MKLKVKELAVFAMLGALMYATKKLMEVLPNIHLIGVFIISMTVVYRRKALYPITIFILLDGLFSAFSTWWIPYLYVWPILFGATLLLPKHLPTKRQPIVYMCLCASHGFLFGTLYAPAQALLFGLSFEGMLAWIVAGFPFDIVHGISNFLCGTLIVPMISVLRRAESYTKNN